MYISVHGSVVYIEPRTTNPRVGGSTPGRVECACVLGQDTLSRLLRDSEITLSRRSRVQALYSVHVKSRAESLNCRYFAGYKHLPIYILRVLCYLNGFSFSYYQTTLKLYGHNIGQNI